MKPRSLTLLLLLLFALSGCTQLPVEESVSASPIAEEPDATLPESFPDDFEAPIDTGGLGKGEVIQGWGGAGAVTRNPILFLHGNGSDARMFRGYAEAFHERYGYRYSELWAFSYQGHPSGSAENTRTNYPTPHQNAVDDVHEMVERILAYTGRPKVTLVTYSLGATLGRYYLKKYDAYDKVDIFVSIVGANQGFFGAEEAGEFEWSRKQIHEMCVHPSGDETPYGRSTDEAIHLPPEENREITWVVIHGGKDDYLLNYNLSTKEQMDEGNTSELSGADINASFEGVFTSLNQRVGAQLSFYHEMEKMFPVLDLFFLDNR
jgi:hypothetical protein